MRLLLTCSLLGIWQTLIWGQTVLPGDVSSFFNEPVENQWTFTLLFDKSLPVGMNLGMVNDEIKGLLSYPGVDEDILMEGEISDKGDFQLFEFDDYLRITSIISGNIFLKENWSWQSADYKRILPISISDEWESKKEVVLLANETSQSSSFIFLRKSTKDIQIRQSGNLNLLWDDYRCDGIECVEFSVNQDLKNPVEFELSHKKKMEVLVHPDQLYRETDKLPFANVSSSKFDFFYSFNFPKIGESSFDDFMQDMIYERIAAFQDSLKSAGIKDQYKPRNRFVNRTYGDFFLTALGRDIISGFLYFYGTSTNKMETVSFIYDRKKKRFYQLGNIFKSGFDYPFFVKSFIQNSKRRALYQEKKMVKTLLKDARYNQLVLVPKGLLLFTDFHLVYGRRKVLIPFEEIHSFIDNKVITNFFKKRQ